MTDPQSRAFREASEDDWEQSSLFDKPDGTLDSLDDDSARIYSVEDYENADWDAERAGPKTLDEARENLAARIADPACPDTENDAGAYDDLDPNAADTFADDSEDT